MYTVDRQTSKYTHEVAKAAIIHNTSMLGIGFYNDLSPQG